jgi:hypothetical protein
VDRLRDAGWTFLGGALFPRLAHRLRWPTRLGPRGLLLYIAFNTALGMAVRTWVIPFFRHHAEERERLRAELTRELHRDPTDEELSQHVWAHWLGKDGAPAKTGER